MADNLPELLAELNVDLKNIDDSNLRRCIVGQLNIIQQMSSELTRLREENQKLKDEIARLKGEQGKPDIRVWILLLNKRTKFTMI